MTTAHSLFYYSLPRPQRPAGSGRARDGLDSWLHKLFSSPVLCAVKTLKYRPPSPTIPPVPHEMPFGTGGSHRGTCPPQSIGLWGQGGAGEAWVILCHGTKRSTRAGINYVWHHFLLHGKDMRAVGKSAFNICIINRKLAQSNSTFCCNRCLQMDERPAEKH